MTFRKAIFSASTAAIVLFGLHAALSAAIVHRYTFDSDAQDSVGTAHGALNNGASITTSSGEYVLGSGALKLEGGSEHVALPAIDFGNSFTVAAWFYLNPSLTSGRTLIANRNTGATQNGFHFYIDAGSNTLILETANSGGSNNAALSSSGATGAGAYHHMAITVDRTAGTALMYWDGVDVTSDSSIRNDFNTNASTNVGSALNLQYTLSGFIDDLRIYDTVLEAEDVEALAQVPEPASMVLAAMAASVLALASGLRRRKTAGRI